MKIFFIAFFLVSLSSCNFPYKVVKKEPKCFECRRRVAREELLNFIEEERLREEQDKSSKW